MDVSDPETDIEVQPPVKVRTTTAAPSTPTPEPIIHVGTTDVTVQLGGTALLHCEIANLSGKTVSPASRHTVSKFDSKRKGKTRSSANRIRVDRVPLPLWRSDFVVNVNPSERSSGCGQIRSSVEVA